MIHEKEELGLKLTTLSSYVLHDMKEINPSAQSNVHINTQQGVLVQDGNIGNS